MKSGYLIIIIAAVVVAIALAPSSWFKDSGPQPEYKSTAEMMQYLASQAVEMADKNSGILLDYTPESIEKLDIVLGKIHDEYQRTKSTQGLQGLAMAYGAYIGEVIRRTHPDAKWLEGDSVGGDKSYPIQWQGGNSYVVAWCYRRITNGDEDNVWHKYLAIKDHAWKQPDTEKAQPESRLASNQSAPTAVAH